MAQIFQIEPYETGACPYGGLSRRSHAYFAHSQQRI